MQTIQAARVRSSRAIIRSVRGVTMAACIVAIGLVGASSVAAQTGGSGWHNRLAEVEGDSLATVNTSSDNNLKRAPVAQLDRATVSETVQPLSETFDNPHLFDFPQQNARQTPPPSATVRQSPPSAAGTAAGRESAASATRETPQKRLDWPSITAAAIGQILGDGGTTVYFLTGHGESASHVGPCVEANPLFQPSTHQIAKIMLTKVALVGGLGVLNYAAEHWHPTATARSSAEQRAKAATTLRIVSRSVNYFAATEGFMATFHNMNHCGI